ncbi:MAG: hypothetical protein ACREMB_11005 [Candidatus Rokuibacteriota bacterium]
MAEISLTSGFGTVPAGSQEGILRVLRTAMEQIDQEEKGWFRKARAVFTESDEQCVFTVELDGKKAPTPLRLELETLEDAVIDSGAQSLVKEDLRAYFRKALGK